MKKTFLTAIAGVVSLLLLAGVADAHPPRLVRDKNKQRKSSSVRNKNKNDNSNSSTSESNNQQE